MVVKVLKLFSVLYMQVETLRADNTFVTEQMANCKGIFNQ